MCIRDSDDGVLEMIELGFQESRMIFHYLKLALNQQVASTLTDCKSHYYSTLRLLRLLQTYYTSSY